MGLVQPQITGEGISPVWGFGRNYTQAYLLDFEIIDVCGKCGKASDLEGLSQSSCCASPFIRKPQDINRYQVALAALWRQVIEGGRNSVAAFRALDERAFGKADERDKQREAGIQVGVSLKNYIEHGSKIAPPAISGPSDGKERAPLAINGPGEKGVGGPPIHPLGAPGQNTVPSPDHAGDAKIESPIDVTGVFVDATKL